MALAGFSDWIAGGRRGRAGNGPVSDGPDSVPRAAGRKVCPGANAASPAVPAATPTPKPVCPIRCRPPRRRLPRRTRTGPATRRTRRSAATVIATDQEGCGDSRCSGNEGPREGDRFGREGPSAGGRSGKEGDGRRRRPRKPAEKAAHPGASRPRDRIRRTLAAQYKQAFNSRDNTAADLIKFCWASGCESEVYPAHSPASRSTPSPACAGMFLAAATSCSLSTDGHLPPAWATA